MPVVQKYLAFDFAAVCAEAIVRERISAATKGDPFRSSDIERVIREQDALRLDRPGMQPLNGSAKKKETAQSIAERIYGAYPKKVGRNKALKAIDLAMRDVPAAELLANTEEYARCVAKWPARERQYVPHPSTWFNRGSYADDPKEWRAKIGAEEQTPRKPLMR
jgi:hypothetical protein